MTDFVSLLMTILSFIVVLGILIFVHELGHFLLAKAVGVRVLKFSLGFGPRLFGKKVGDTDYRVSAIPLGGYVKMAGDSPYDEVSEEDKQYSFLSQKNWKKILIVAAGPFFNFFFAIFVLWIVFMIGVPVGEPRDDAIIGELTPDFPAMEAGLLNDDAIVSIDGNRVGDWDEMSAIIQASDGSAMEIVVMRDGEELVFYVTPTLEEYFTEDLDTKEKYMIGIAPVIDYSVLRMGPVSAFIEGIKRTGFFVSFTFLALGKIISGAIPMDNIGGPILIAQVSGEAARLGLVAFLNLLAIISIHLGILNLLPVPVLDGGHILFFTIEAIIRRPINTRIKEAALYVGLSLLVLLMTFAFYADIKRLFFSG